MAETTNSHSVIARGKAVTLSNRPGPRDVQHPADRPGVVIFLHGVNDPGASYEHVEKGLCEGLNERLSRKDLRSGEYGVAFETAKDVDEKNPTFTRWKKIKYDPDTYQFLRSESSEVGRETHSMLIPFYWGYRAAPSEIKGGERNPTTLRGQYQDIYGSRLSKNFAKGGGMFNNATTNIPEMYGPGFQKSAANAAAQKFGMSDYQYSTRSPDRHYFVLAAVRLAMVIREIRRVDPDETVTVMAHSQGTVITLLAQAMLADGTSKGDRCADCVIMVDSPYSLGETAIASIVQPSAVKYTTRGKLNTLINIVKEVTSNPHTSPPLSELKFDNASHGGRTGKGWSPDQATRCDSKDGSTHVFAERDNRGKVYLYFCTEDSTVAIPAIQGIGTYGVPDTVAEDWDALPPNPDVSAMMFGGTGREERTDTLNAMSELKQHRFYQRLWSKGGGMADGKPRTIGKPPECIEHIAKGSFPGATENRTINAEAIVPPYLPNLYGDEAIKGTPNKPGLDRPDYIGRDTLLGNPNAQVQQIIVHNAPADVKVRGSEAVLAWFNAQFPDPEDHTASVRQSDGMGELSTFYREETPNETRKRLGDDRSKWDGNSYHSAILRSDDNMRRVAAMDVAIGQAKSLDDMDMRNLLIAIADWKTDQDKVDDVKGNPRFATLLPESQQLIEASFAYYMSGRFPSRFVPLSPPAIVDKETVGERMVRR